MKDDALPQIHLVRDTDLGIFAYELHILAGDFLRESEFNLRSLAANTGPDSIAIMGKKHLFAQFHCLPFFNAGLRLRAVPVFHADAVRVEGISFYVLPQRVKIPLCAGAGDGMAVPLF